MYLIYCWCFFLKRCTFKSLSWADNTESLRMVFKAYFNAKKSKKIKVNFFFPYTIEKKIKDTLFNSSYSNQIDIWNLSGYYLHGKFFVNSFSWNFLREIDLYKFSKIINVLTTFLLLTVCIYHFPIIHAAVMPFPPKKR